MILFKSAPTSLSIEQELLLLLAHRRYKKAVPELRLPEHNLYSITITVEQVPVEKVAALQQS